jgi:uncharacterized protein YsxB (DUF464 family)
MVKVTINKNEDIIEEITIAGHAGYAAKGEDIVCAAVSSIAITSVNDINALDDSVNYVENDGYLKITVKKDTEINQKILNNMVVTLQELESQYPKNILVRNEE